LFGRFDSSEQRRYRGAKTLGHLDTDSVLNVRNLPT
jgi:hypothetical protein